MNAQAPEIDDAERPRPATMKFTYPTGARPLEGYTIKRGVGRGGFGEVYFATSDAGKEVALKLIRRNLDVELRGVTQCLNLKHPNLIALYDIRTDGMGDQWVVMEYVSGESLEDVIERNPNGMPADQALAWMRGICAGVAYLHDHGIVHRDLKPGNIFLDEGTVKIGDYGLAKFISCSRRSGQTESVGTVHYMAPEIANGRYGREIDTYALGIVLFEMLTGHVPFEGESVGEVLMKHLTAEPDLSALSQPYRSIVERALAKDPNLRLNGVGELMSLLPGGEGHVVPSSMVTPSAISAQDEPIPAWPVSRGPALKAADAAAMDGLKQVVNWNKPEGENADVAGGEAAKLEEPIWKAIREFFSGESFQKTSSLKKAIVIFSLVVACVVYGDNWFSILSTLVVCYFIYYVIWSSITQQDAKKSKSGKKTKKAADAAVAGLASDERKTIAWPNHEVTDPAIKRMGVTRSPHRPIRSTWRERANRELLAKPLREKLSELLGSMLLASLVAAIAACAGPLFSMDATADQNISWYLWLALVGTVGSWAVLIPAKFAEGKIEDQVPLRLAQLIFGALVGVFAWYLASVLLLTTPAYGEPVNVGEGLVSNSMLGWPKSADARIYPVYYIAYFAFLFLIPRWWRQAEFTRSTRLSLWLVICCVGWGWLLHVFWWFPQPAGMLTAGVIAVATQLASPWMPPSQRRALSEAPTSGAV